MSVTLPLLYQDGNIVVCDKPAGVPSEETKDLAHPGVPDLLRTLWNDPAAYVGVLHRLDVGVSGVMVYARTPHAAAELSRQISRAQTEYAELDRVSPQDAEKTSRRNGSPVFQKEYRAVFVGAPDDRLPPSGQLRDYLFKDSRSGKVFAVSRPRKGVKEAVLDYEVMQTVFVEDVPYSLVSVRLHTGRTHQIRVQFASRRHPLWGDGKYGSRQKGAIALRSVGLSFRHPVTRCPLTFAVPLPDELPWTLFSSLF